MIAARCTQMAMLMAVAALFLLDWRYAAAASGDELEATYSDVRSHVEGGKDLLLMICALPYA